MALPPVEPLYANLCALRDAEDPTDPRHDPRWREVARWLEQAFPGARQELEDARQETLVSLFRHIRHMRAESPLQAAKWVATILRRKRVDRVRARASDPVQKALLREPPGGDHQPLVDRLVAAESPERGALDGVVTRVLEHVHRALEEDPSISPMRRQLRRAQAEATLLRLVVGAEGAEIAGALEAGEPITVDRVYKWIERGRAVVHLGLSRWERAIEDEDERAEAAPVIEVLRELVDERRADAGVPRPSRRKERTEQP